MLLFIMYLFITIIILIMMSDYQIHDIPGVVRAAVHLSGGLLLDTLGMLQVV